MRRNNKRLCRIGLPAIIAAQLVSHSALGVDATWIGSFGSWNDPSKWSTNPNFPNNGSPAGATYDTTVHTAGVISVRIPITVNSVLCNGSLTTLDIGESLTVSGKLTLAGGTLSAGQYFYGSRTLSAATLAVAGGTINAFDGTILNTYLDGGTGCFLQGVTLDHCTISGSIGARGSIVQNGLVLDHANMTFRNEIDGLKPLQFLGAQSLTGSGEIDLDATSEFCHLSQTDVGGGTVNFGSGILIRNISGGLIGNSLYPLNNAGTISSDSGTALIQGSSFVNSGTLAAAGGTLSIQASMVTSGIGHVAVSSGAVAIAGPLNNSNATLDTSIVGSISLGGGTISGGTIGGGELHVLSGTVDAVTLTGTLSVDANKTLQIKNNLDFSGGTLALRNASAATFTGDSTLSGSGDVIFTDGALNNSGALTIGPGITVKTAGGTGVIGSTLQPLVNQGTISAESPGTSLTVYGNNWVNQGALRASNSATLALNGSFNATDLGDFASTTGGQIRIVGTLNNNANNLLLDGPTHSLTLFGVINGGTISSINGASLTVLSATFNGLTLNSDVVFPAVGLLAVQNGLTLLDHQFDVQNSSINGTLISFQGAQALGGTGTIPLDGTKDSKLISDSSLSIGSGVTIHTGTRGGTIDLGNGSNAGTLSAETSGQTLNVGGGSWTNTSSGVLRASNNGTLTLFGNWHNAGLIQSNNATLAVGGSFTIPDIGNLSRTGGAVLITGTLNSSSNSTLDLDTTTGAWKLQGGRINGITVNATPPAFLGIAGIATLDGVTLNSDVVFDNFSTAVVLDSLRLNGAPSGIGTFSMTGSNDNLQQDVGTLTFTSGITAFSNGTSQIGNPSLPLINQGTITASSAAGSISVLGSTVTNSGAIRLLLGAQATVSNCSNYANNTLSGGIWFVAGSGTLRIPGADIVTNAANITLDGANANIFADNGTLNALRNFATNTGTFTIQSGRTFAIASLTNSGQLTASSGGVISITGTLTNSGTVTVGSGGTITTTTSITGTLTNSGTVSIGAFGALTAGTITGSGIIKNDGTLLFSSATDSDQTYVRGAGTTNLASARLTLTNVQQTRLTLTNSAAMTLTSRSNGGTLSTIKTLSIDANSKLDLKDTDLAIDYSGTTPRTTIRGYLLSGYSSSSWSGPQLTSSTAQAIASDGQQVHKTALGYGEASVLKLTSFDGQAIDSTTLLIAYTLYGDASLDRVVNALDFNSLATNFGGTSGKAWTEGDFNYDGITNTLDFNALASNFNLALPAPALGSLIPEPAVALAIFAVFVLTPRRRR